MLVNMSVLEACLRTGAPTWTPPSTRTPDIVCEDPPCTPTTSGSGPSAARRPASPVILGVGFDPGVVNAYCALAQKHHFDTIDTIDIIDINAGSHGRYFATNFDPEINFSRVREGVDLIDRDWKEFPTYTVKRIAWRGRRAAARVPQTVTTKLHSLSRHIDANSIRFWMGFGDYINVFTVLRTLGFLGHLPVTLDDGTEVAPLKVVKALFPDPM
ncbi:MAG: hypothetical protein R2705_22590 [Ilumatobacteraceae bacterium]